MMGVQVGCWIASKEKLQRRKIRCHTKKQVGNLVIPSPAKSSTTSRGVESSSTLLESAMNIGGIAYQSPDELITHIAEEGTTISPAIVVLEDDVEYTFKFVDDANPDGVTLDATAFEEADGVVWEQGLFFNNCHYEVTYDPQTNTNTFSADRRIGNIGTPMASDMYTPGSTHKISSDVVGGPKMVDIYLDGSTCICDTPQLLKVWSHDDPIVIRLIHTGSGSIWYANSVVRDDNGGRPPAYYDSGEIYFYQYSATLTDLVTRRVSIAEDNSLSYDMTKQTITVT